MKKILFAAMVCCVALSGVMSSCDNNKPEEKSGLEAWDPYMVWGANYADVQNHMAARTDWLDGNDSLEYWPNQGWHKWYWVGENLTEQYLFETQDGQNLWEIECYCRNTNISVDEGRKYLENLGYIFLSKRHVTTPDDENLEIYMSADRVTRAMIVMPTDGSAWFIDYIPMPVAD